MLTTASITCSATSAMFSGRALPPARQRGEQRDRGGRDQRASGTAGRVQDGREWPAMDV